MKTFLVNMMTKMMKLVMNLENPWSPLSSGERCKCERHFSDLKDGHDYGQRGHGHQNVTSSRGGTQISAQDRIGRKSSG